MWETKVATHMTMKMCVVVQCCSIGVCVSMFDKGCIYTCGCTCCGRYVLNVDVVKQVMNMLGGKIV